jgi:hypothetical protein
MRAACFVAGVWTLVSVHPVSGQWFATRLHPLGAYDTSLGGLSATRQFGLWQETAFSVQKPVIWSGAASFIDLAPGPTDWGALTGGSDALQFGDFRGRAAIWHGTPSSRVDLDPAGQFGSFVLGAAGSEQVGVRGSPQRATLWRGTAASMVDLHPAGALESGAHGTDGTRQGGYVHFNTEHAALWSGTAASVVDLNPPGAGSSGIYGMVPGQQVGFATVGAQGLLHAIIWSGTAASFVDLNPPGNTSQLFATCGSAQVGILNGGQAAIWFGTATSVVNLHSFLPASYYLSFATCVHEKNGTFYVGGWARQSSGTPQEAFLWVGTPACYANCDGSTAAPALNVADFACFLQRFSEGDLYANCDRSTTPPSLNVADFACFLQSYARACN